MATTVGSGGSAPYVVRTHGCPQVLSRRTAHRTGLPTSHDAEPGWPSRASAGPRREDDEVARDVAVVLDELAEHRGEAVVHRVRLDAPFGSR